MVIIVFLLLLTACKTCHKIKHLLSTSHRIPLFFSEVETYKKFIEQKEEELSKMTILQQKVEVRIFTAIVSDSLCARHSFDLACSWDESWRRFQFLASEVSLPREWEELQVKCCAASCPGLDSFLADVTFLKSWGGCRGSFERQSVKALGPSFDLVGLCARARCLRKKLCRASLEKSWPKVWSSFCSAVEICKTFLQLLGTQRSMTLVEN